MAADRMASQEGWLAEQRLDAAVSRAAARGAD
jgi:hypothetical protein